MTNPTLDASVGGGTHAEEQGAAATRIFGFWVYLMSDVILFAGLFATYGVLATSYAGGPTGSQIFELRGVLVETLFLLTNSFTFGLAILARNANRRELVFLWLGLTFALGAAFLGIELREFARLVAAGNGPDRSAFLSAFFALVGTHGLHVAVGLLWMLVLASRIATGGLSTTNRTRLATLGLFWHFLDIVWICVFSFVYLLGV